MRKYTLHITQDENGRIHFIHNGENFSNTEIIGLLTIMINKIYDSCESKEIEK